MTSTEFPAGLVPPRSTGRPRDRSGVAGRLLPGFRLWWHRQIERERSARSGFAWLPIAMMAGILGFYVSGARPPVWAPAGVAAAALAIRLLVPDRPWGRWMLVLLAWSAIGVGAAALEIARTDTVILSGDATVRITGTVLHRERDDRGRLRYTLDLTATERPVLSRPPSRVRILVSSRHAPLPIGGTYRGLVRLRPPAGPAYPGAYDFAFAPYFDGLGAYGFSLGAPEASAEIRPATFGDRVARLRLSMDEKIRAVLPGATGAVASALITGERAGIPDEIEEALRATSLAHVLSISGFHMALVAGFTMLVVRAAIAAVPRLALRYPSKKFGAVAALAVSSFYFLLSGDNAATERSFVMIAIMLVAVLVDRPALTLRNVSIAALVVMALSPHVVLTATFQMSFAATAALIGAYGAYSRWRGDRDRLTDRRSRSWIRSALIILAGMALSSLIAGAATAPYGIYHFQRVAPFGLVANVLATPIFSLWIMPLALLSAVAMPFGVEAIFLHPMGWGLDLVFRLAAEFARLLPDQAVGRISAESLVVFTAAILVLSFSASGLRWLAAPLAGLGLMLMPPGPRPELLVFEDGREIVVLRPDGGAARLREKPNGFVGEQWERAFGWTATDPPRQESLLAGSDTAGTEARTATPADAGFVCADAICRITTPSGRRVAWTDDYETMGILCDTADIAIVARAMRAETCRSGAHLVTLRTLRRSGSLAFAAGSALPAAADQTASIPVEVPEWNRHRLAPWPEFWRKPEIAPAEAGGNSDGDPPPSGGTGDDARSPAETARDTPARKRQ